MVYIDLNMVRCRVVPHPREWAWCGYQELMGLRQRFRIIDFERVLEALGGVRADEFRQHYEERIMERIAKDEMKREPEWTEAIAVGSERFVREMAQVIRGRQDLVINGTGETWTLKEAEIPYDAFPGSKTSCRDHC